MPVRIKKLSGLRRKTDERMSRHEDCGLCLFTAQQKINTM